MARIRTIKPEFWTDEDMSELSEPSALLAIGLLNYSDDEGYFNANPSLIKAAIFPIREPSKNIPGMLQELSDCGYICTYSDKESNKVYGHVVNFTKHQRVDKAKPSEIKELKINSGSIQDESKNDQGRVLAGKEGNGRERKELDAFFDLFWAKFPNKKDKQASRKAFVKLRPDEILLKQMLEAIDKQIAWRKTMKENGEWCEDWKYGQGWITGRRWEDEISVKAKTNVTNLDGYDL